jgi:hypothetical protein
MRTSGLNLVGLLFLSSAMIVGCTQGDAQDSQKAIADLKVLARTDQMTKIIGDGVNLTQNVQVSFIEHSDTEVTMIVTAESALTDAVELSGSCTYELGSGRWELKSSTSEIANIYPGLVCSDAYNLP